MRTAERLRAHYEIERELASRLLRSTPAERSRLYGQVYEELFRRVPDHPQLTRAASPDEIRREALRQLRPLRSLLRPAIDFIEIGAGDCALSLAAAPLVRSVTAIEVSPTIAAPPGAPPNFRLRLTDGLNLPLPDASADLVYSNQLMEHLHPDDALAQLREITRVLRPGGAYLCITPSRHSGPHDISKYFSPVPDGFHLREYTAADLIPLFRSAGFTQFHHQTGARGHCLPLPASLFLPLESLAALLPRPLRQAEPLRALLGVRLLAQNQSNLAQPSASKNSPLTFCP